MVAAKTSKIALFSVFMCYNDCMPEDVVLPSKIAIPERENAF
jgi:hypothetical protein